MKREYLLWHWALTLLIAPFTSQAIDLCYGRNPNQVVGLLEVYPITLLFSIFFSIPTFLVYLLCFYLLSNRKINFTISRLVLVAVSVIGIITTQTFISGSMSQVIIIAYSLTTILVGLFLKIRKQ
jgi:hypothetical protein